MANRLTRDQILNRGLDLLDSPRLNEIDRSGGTGPTSTIVANALSIGWLQDALDLAHNLYPLASTIQTSSYTFTTGVNTYTLPSGYIVDYKDGVILGSDQGRMYRRSLSVLLRFPVATSAYGKPRLYCVRNGNLEIRPTPDQSYAATLYYYALPTALSGSTIPSFPSDFMLVEYVKMRGLEWLRELPQDSANKYLIATMGQLVKAGLGQEAEEDQISVDPNAFPGEPSNWSENSWMISCNGIL